MSRALLLLASAVVLTAVAGCGGPTTMTMYGHTIVYEGNREHPTMSYDGRALSVRWNESIGAYQAEGCDVGPAGTIDLLAEQVAASPSECTSRVTE